MKIKKLFFLPLPLVRRSYFSVAVLFFLPLFLNAQDVHWSQPSGCLLYQNPAFAGIEHQYSFNLDYRNQWNAAGTRYQSYFVAGDYRLGKSAEENNTFFSVGGLFFNDVAGDGHYRTTNAGLLFSCNVKANDHWRMGAGAGFNFLAHALQMDDFSWGSQFDGINYNSTINSGEALGTYKNSTFDMNAGVSARYTKNPGTLSSNDDVKLIFGYSLNHITRPNIGFFGSSMLDFKHTVFANGIIGLHNKNVSLKPVLLFYMQGKQMEITGGSLISFSYGEQSKITGFKKGSSFSVGALYRYNDAIIHTAQKE
jgi:type IX secretion system PorP/SprF family membrane protein